MHHLMALQVDKMGLKTDRTLSRHDTARIHRFSNSKNMRELINCRTLSVGLHEDSTQTTLASESRTYYKALVSVSRDS